MAKTQDAEKRVLPKLNGSLSKHWTRYKVSVQMHKKQLALAGYTFTFEKVDRDNIVSDQRQIDILNAQAHNSGLYHIPTQDVIDGKVPIKIKRMRNDDFDAVSYTHLRAHET